MSSSETSEVLNRTPLYINIHIHAEYCLYSVSYGYSSFTNTSYYSFQEALEKLSSAHFGIPIEQISSISIKITYAKEDNFTPLPKIQTIDLRGINNIGKEKKIIRVTISDKYEENREQPVLLPIIKTDVIFSYLMIQGLTINNEGVLLYTSPQITKNLTFVDCTFNNKVTFSPNISRQIIYYDHRNIREQFKYPHIFFTSNTFNEEFLLRDILLNDLILTDNIFKNSCEIRRNIFNAKFLLIDHIFKEKLDLTNNIFENSCTFKNNSFEKQTSLSSNTFYNNLFLKGTNFKESLDLSYSYFAGAILLASSIFKENLITYNVKLISPLDDNLNDNVNLSPAVYTKNCIKNIELFANKTEIPEEFLNNFRLSSCIIKSNLINAHNKIDASKWMAIELFVQTHIQKKLLALDNFSFKNLNLKSLDLKNFSFKNLGEWAVFSLSGLVSNHQQNIIRPFVCLFALFVVVSLFFNLNILNEYFNALKLGMPLGLMLGSPIWLMLYLSGFFSKTQQDSKYHFTYLLLLFIVVLIPYNGIKISYYDITSNLWTSIVSLVNAYKAINFSEPLDFINPLSTVQTLYPCNQCEVVSVLDKSLFSKNGFIFKFAKIVVSAVVGYIVWHIIQTSRYKTK